MSCSRKVNQLHVKTAVFLLRSYRWLQNGNLKKSKPEAELLKAKILTNYYAKKYLGVTENLEQKEITVETPETIWQFWDNPAGHTTPPIVKSCLASVNRFKGNFDRKILNRATFENYSDLPGYILDKLNKGFIDYTHFSDLLRLNLLKNHGGVWLDATAYMTDFLPDYIIKEDFFVLLADKLSHFPYSFMQNCFIRAKKGSFLCDAWHEMCIEYWKRETKISDYFQHQLMFKALISNQSVARNLFELMPKISEDEIHQLVGNNLLKKFDADEWERIKKASFFQKTTYKVPPERDYSGTYFSELSKGIA
jgi:Capsular polysaccharide synthesis protein